MNDCKVYLSYIGTNGKQCLREFGPDIAVVAEDGQVLVRDLRRNVETPIRKFGVMDTPAEIGKVISGMIKRREK